MPITFSHRNRGANATYFDSGTVESGNQDHALKKVEVTFYPGDKVKITIDKACPVVITQAYLAGEGNDAILEIAPRAGSAEE